jgi:hypothetical protein
VRDAEALDPAKVIVTTDYEACELPEKARPYWVTRPVHLCGPDTPMTLVLKHVAQDMYPMDTILLMQPNCYHPDRIRLSLRVLKENRAGTSVRYPDFWHPAYAIGGKMPKNRQGLDPAYRPDGLIYRIPVAHLLMVHPFTGTYIPTEGTANVDTECDWTNLRQRYDDNYWNETGV